MLNLGMRRLRDAAALTVINEKQQSAQENLECKCFSWNKAQNKLTFQMQKGGLSIETIINFLFLQAI